MHESRKSDQNTAIGAPCDANESDAFAGKKPNATRALAYSTLVFIAGASYGFIVPVIKGANEIGVYPASFLPIQYLVSFVVLLAIVLIKRVPWSSVRSSLPLAILGLFTGGTSICYYNAVTLLPSSAALTLLFQYIWISVLVECVHRRKLPTASSVVAIVVVLVGTLFATGLFDGEALSLDPAGVAFGVGSAVCYALFLYLSGTFGTDKPALLRTTMLAAGGLLVTSLANPSAYVVSMPDPATWPYGIGLAMLGVLFPTFVINYASPHLSAGMVSIMASSELPVGILAAWAIVGDTPTPLVLFGAMLVLTGILCKQAPSLFKLKTRLRSKQGSPS